MTKEVRVTSDKKRMKNENDALHISKKQDSLINTFLIIGSILLVGLVVYTYLSL